MPHVALVANPAAADTPSVLDAIVPAVDHRLAEGVWDSYEVLGTSARDGGSSATRDAVAGGADLVLVVGGDGTVRAAAETLAGTGIPLGVLPAGRTNLLAQALGVPLDPLRALAAAVDGETVGADLARMDDGSGAFTTMAVMGADAAPLVPAGSPDAAGAGAWPGFTLATPAASRRGRFAVEISLDGAPVLRRQALAVVVGNVARLQGTPPPLSEGPDGDGLLDVCVLAPRRRLQVLTRAVGHRATDDDPQWERWRARQVLVRAAERQPRRLDGQQIADSSALDASVVPGAVLVRVPWARPLSEVLRLDDLAAVGVSALDAPGGGRPGILGS